jgi:hypothetical protein
MFDDAVAQVSCIRVFYPNAVRTANMAMTLPHNLQLGFPEGSVSALSSYGTGLNARNLVIPYRSLTWTRHRLCVFSRECHVWYVS